MNRREQLAALQSMGRLSDSEAKEWAALQQVVQGDGGDAMILPPKLAGNSDAERLADFARKYQFYGREASEAEVRAFVTGMRTDRSYQRARRAATGRAGRCPTGIAARR